MKKWQYEIILQTKDGKEYLVWTYSNHFSEDVKLTRKGKKMFNSVGECYGVEHSNTAIQWVLGLWQDIKNGTREDRVKDGKFNPHYRLNDESYPNVWISIKNIKEIYFKMHLLNEGEQPK